MLLNPRADVMRGRFIDHLGAPWRGIDMTVAAGLIAFAPNIDLERLQGAAAQRKPMVGELLVEAVHRWF
jgi:hypothetical protein